MKTWIKNRFIHSVLTAALSLILTGRVTAQTLNVLYSFKAITSYPNINSGGANPQAGVILTGNTLYGTTFEGGEGGSGTVFALNVDGTGFTNLHSFTVIPTYPGPYTNSDGASPYADLSLSGSTLFGTAYLGCSPGN